MLVLSLGGCAEEAAEASTPAAEAPPEAPPSLPAEPEPAAEPPEPSRVVTIAASGDLVLNPHAMRAIEDDGEEGYENLLRGYAAALEEDEIVFVNLEQPLVNDRVPLDSGWPRQDTSRPRRSPILGTTPALAEALAAAGVDVLSVANNHAYDQGRAGLARTLEEIERVGLLGVGAAAGEGAADGAYEPVVVEAHGVRVAFVAFTEFVNQRPTDGAPARVARLNEERVRSSLERARASADLVVASVHWSRDFLTEARPGERRHARRLIEEGADVILGTGPHVLHRVERQQSARGEAVVAYSLGNVVSGMGRTYRVGHRPRAFVHPANVTPEARDGVILRIRIRLDNQQIVVESIAAEALWTRNSWLAHRYEDAPHRVAVERLAEVDADVRAERRPLIAAALGDAVTLSP